ncbi:MAG: endonuclease/exonuclease/phosphatase [Planctomycetaceae bacterium]|nr:endonuclease/exonuclease/phosphatase [Planctomycetaceae bacterium]MBT6487711.1 endonuclease/exonuclease/phosphatase [Planctomycetaceae bacterium]
MRYFSFQCFSVRFAWAFSLTAALLFTGCDDVQQTLEQAGSQPTVSTGGASGGQTQNAAAALKSRDTVSIASFNIQVFGISKLKKQPVMDVLAKVVRRFDVVAIQELRAKDQTVVPKFLELVNADGSNYDSVVGPRLGRTSSKEQYVFLYDSERIQLSRSSVTTVSDPRDLLHREPLVARFRVRSQPAENAFTFTLVNIHTDPDETDTELDALADVFRRVQGDGSNEDDIILLGDLNVDEYHLGRLGRLPNIAWAIAGVKTNTRRTKSYDNIVFDQQATVEYRGKSGVLDLLAEYGLSKDEALDVSDHLPVWGIFSAYEGTRGPLAESTSEGR